jgi:hypothetical protein
MFLILNKYLLPIQRRTYCVRARVIKRSPIYGRILFLFAVNILHITTSSMGYVLFIFTHRAHACERACASARVVKYCIRLSLDGFSSHLLGTYYKLWQVTCATYLSCSRTARMRASARIRARAWLRVRLYMDGFSSNLLWTYYKWPKVTLATYLSYSRTARMRASARMRARAWLRVCLYMDGFSSNLLGTYYKSPQVAWATHFSCSCTAHTRVCDCMS